MKCCSSLYSLMAIHSCLVASSSKDLTPAPCWLFPATASSESQGPSSSGAPLYASAPSSGIAPPQSLPMRHAEITNSIGRGAGFLRAALRTSSLRCRLIAFPPHGLLQAEVAGTGGGAYGLMGGFDNN